uniref:uncharacterized protein n=1 Tax=Myxine glutinosa TaxID=7769 RepID=UPI00358FB02F
MAENFSSESKRRKMNHQDVMSKLRNLRQHLIRNQLNHTHPPQNPFQRVVTEGRPESHPLSLIHTVLQDRDGKHTADGDLGIQRKQMVSAACDRGMENASNDALAACVSHSYTTHAHGSTKPAPLGEGMILPGTKPAEQESADIPDALQDACSAELSFTLQRKLNSQLELLAKSIQHAITEHQKAMHQLLELPVPLHIDLQTQNNITDGSFETNGSDIPSTSYSTMDTDWAAHDGRLADEFCRQAIAMVANASSSLMIANFTLE